MIGEFFIGFIRIHILYHASKEEVFGVALIRELARHGYHTSPGTLYPILHRLRGDGYLSSRAMVVNGKMRRYYRITRKGARVLSECKGRIRELVDEVILEK
ncbi:MAG: PadR family transcriptional regulator [bacterium]|nr:PadR family transcriptional regulator [bacterium]